MCCETKICILITVWRGGEGTHSQKGINLLNICMDISFRINSLVAISPFLCSWEQAQAISLSTKQLTFSPRAVYHQLGAVLNQWIATSVHCCTGEFLDDFSMRLSKDLPWVMSHSAASPFLHNKSWYLHLWSSCHYPLPTLPNQPQNHVGLPKGIVCSLPHTHFSKTLPTSAGFSHGLED